LAAGCSFYVSDMWARVQLTCNSRGAAHSTLAAETPHVYSPLGASSSSWKQQQQQQQQQQQAASSSSLEPPLHNSNAAKTRVGDANEGVLVSVFSAADAARSTRRLLGECVCNLMPMARTGGAPRCGQRRTRNTPSHTRPPQPPLCSSSTTRSTPHAASSSAPRPDHWHWPLAQTQTHFCASATAGVVNVTTRVFELQLLEGAGARRRARVIKAPQRSPNTSLHPRPPPWPSPKRAPCARASNGRQHSSR